MTATRTPPAPTTRGMRSAPHAAPDRVLSGADGGGAVVEPVETEIAPVGLVPDGETILYMRRPSPWFIPLAAAGSVLRIGMLAALFALLPLALPSMPWRPGTFVAIGCAACVLRLGWQALEWYARIHILTDRRVVVRGGVIRVSVYQALLRDVRRTRVFVSARERATIIGTIGFATGGDAYEAFWVMIPRPHEAHQMVQEAIRKVKG